jgi:hypothetical protein
MCQTLCSRLCPAARQSCWTEPPTEPYGSPYPYQCPDGSQAVVAAVHAAPKHPTGIFYMTTQNGASTARKHTSKTRDDIEFLDPDELRARQRRHPKHLHAVSAQDEEQEDYPEPDETEEPKQSCADTLLHIGLDATLIHTPLGELFARVPVTSCGGTHNELHSVREKGGGFRRWLVSRYFDETRQTPNTTALTRVMELFTAHAEQGSADDVYTRLAEHGGAIYLDLANDQWQAVKITSDGWEVVSDCPVYFRRAKGMMPLPTPERGGSLTELRDYLNVATDDDWKMLIGWLVGVFHPDGPYAILAISGEQGTAKTSATRFLRQLVDPNMAPLRDAPEDKRDLVIAAKNGRVLALDNLSSMPQWLSDALCRMATGSGYATRALYTDDDEALFNSRRPVVFNGIEELATRPDLGERCLVLTLQEIDPKHRKTERKLNAAWEEAQPRILGALLDAVCCALAEQDHVHFTELPRMADFAAWVTAAEKHLGWKRGSFVAALERNRESAIQTELEASPVADTLIQFMQARTEWKGTPKELHNTLDELAPDRVKGLPEWPKNSQKLSGKLRRLAPALRANGIAIIFGKSGGERYVEVKHIGYDPQGRNRDATEAKRDATGTQGTQQGRNFSAVASLSETRNRPENGPTGTQGTQDHQVFLPLDLSEEREEESVVEKPGKVASLASLASLSGDQRPAHAGSSLLAEPSNDGPRCPNCGTWQVWPYLDQKPPTLFCHACMRYFPLAAA